jgi:metallo-beta-lactamase family protein
MATLTFLGATGTVTGSKFLLQQNGFRLLVDCGLFQGLKELRLRNWSAPPLTPSELGGVALTHAHLDHTGYLPVLARHGYEGPVWATPATVSFSGIILPDSGHLQEEDARFANKRGYSKHRPALPLYTEEEARKTLRLFDPVPFDRPLEVHDGVSLTWRAAGHIPGAATLEVRLRSPETGKEKVVLFSGDLGRYGQPIVPDPTPPVACDVMVLESTYGNRDHTTEDPKDRLAVVLRETFERGGSVLIPAFAVGRTQLLLFLLRELQDEGRLPKDVPIYMDSPMAIEATRIVTSHREAHNGEMKALEAAGDLPLVPESLHVVSAVEDSKALNDIRYPAVIISASGMAEGGRILHHLAYKLSDHRTTILFVGFQAAGTRGRALQHGAEKLRMHGKEIAVRARIETLDGLSAHADRNEIERWLDSGDGKPGRVYLVHGEPEARDALADRLRERRKLDVHTPEYQEKIRI